MPRIAAAMVLILGTAWMSQVASEELDGAAVVARPSLSDPSGDLVTLITRGLRHRESLLEFVEGRATVCTLRSPHSLALALKSDRAAQVPNPQEQLKWELERTLFAWAGEDEWQLQVANLICSGRSFWGFSKVEATPWGEAVKYPYLERLPRQVLTEMCNGDAIYKWDTLTGTGRVTPLSEESRYGSTFSFLRRHILMLEAAGENLSAYVASSDDWKATTAGGEKNHLVTLTRSFSTATHAVAVQLTLDMDRGFMPVVIEDFGRERSDPRRAYRFRWEVLEGDRIREGLWMPTEVVRRSYAYVPGAANAWGGTTRVTLDGLVAYDLRPPDLLRSKFPLGTVILDARDGNSYHQGNLQTVVDRFRARAAQFEASETERAKTDPLAQPLP